VTTESLLHRVARLMATRKPGQPYRERTADDVAIALDAERTDVMREIRRLLKMGLIGGAKLPDKAGTGYRYLEQAIGQRRLCSDADFRRLWESSLTTYEIASKLGYGCNSSVSHRAKRMGLSLRKAGRGTVREAATAWGAAA